MRQAAPGSLDHLGGPAQVALSRQETAGERRRRHEIGRELHRILSIEPAGGGHQPCAGGFRGLRRAFPHLHEERVGLGLGDQADDGLLLGTCRRDGARQDQGETNRVVFTGDHPFRRWRIAPRSRSGRVFVRSC